MAKLTALGVKNARHPGGSAHLVRIGDGGGLFLTIKPTGAKSWVLRVQVSGRRRDIGLGSDSDLTLAEAREKAAHLRKLARQGKDPIAERDREKAVMLSFAQAVERAHADLRKGWEEKTAAQFLSSLKAHAVPKLGMQRVADISSEHVIAALRPIWTDKPQIARKVRHRILQVLAYAKSHGWRNAPVPTADELRRGLAKQPKGGSFAAVPYSDVPNLVQAELAKEPTAARLALLFAIHTAARSGEVRRAEWGQIDREARTWTRPPEIMKAGVEHVITLNAGALAILDRAADLFGEQGLIFRSAREAKPLSDMSLAKMLRLAGREETVHGFRSSFRDWAAEQMPQVPAMVAETALAHSVGNATERAYLRSDLRDLREQLMDAWDRYLSGCSETKGAE